MTLQKCFPVLSVVVVVAVKPLYTELKLVCFTSLFPGKVNTVQMIYNWSAVPSPHWAESTGANLSCLTCRLILCNQRHLSKCSHQIGGTSLLNCSRLKQTLLHSVKQSKPSLIRPRGCSFTLNSIINRKLAVTQSNKITPVVS